MTRGPSMRTLGFMSGLALTTSMAYRAEVPNRFNTSLIVQAEESMEDPYRRSRKNETIGGEDFAILSGDANRELAESIAKKLGRKLIPGNVRKFADGETAVAFA